MRARRLLGGALAAGSCSGSSGACPGCPLPLTRALPPACLPARLPGCSTRIDNPAYKGIWVAPDIDNPEYKHDDKLYLQKDIKYVGFELWQVKSGSIFDNIIVTDDLAAAKKLAEATWGKNKEGEQEMFNKLKEVRPTAAGAWAAAAAAAAGEHAAPHAASSGASMRAHALPAGGDALDLH